MSSICFFFSHLICMPFFFVSSFFANIFFFFTSNTRPTMHHITHLGSSFLVETRSVFLVLSNSVSDWLHGTYTTAVSHEVIFTYTYMSFLLVCPAISIWYVEFFFLFFCQCHKLSAHFFFGFCFWGTKCIAYFPFFLREIIH